MPVIKPAGLLSGNRMAMLSDEARLYWPFLYAASNGYGRFRIDYLSLLQLAFAQFHSRPDQETVRRILAEYRDSHLLFLYRAPDGSVWAAWDSASGQRYFSAEDKASPAPPEKEFSEWRTCYHSKKEEREQVQDNACDDLASSLFSTTTQKSLDFGEKNEVFSAEPTQTQRTQTHVLTQTQVLNTAQTRARAPETPVSPEESTQEAPVQRAPGHLLELEPDPPLWRALLFAADQAHMIYAEGELDAIRRRWGEYAEKERLDGISGIEIRLKTGEFHDAHFVPSLRRYVFDRRWTAKLRPGPQLVRGQPSRDRRQVASDRFDERMNEVIQSRGKALNA